MTLKSFFGTGIKAALDQARIEMGPEAMLVSSRPAPPEGLRRPALREEGRAAQRHKRTRRTESNAASESYSPSQAGWFRVCAVPVSS